MSEISIFVLYQLDLNQMLSMITTSHKKTKMTLEQVRLKEYFGVSFSFKDRF